MSVITETLDVPGAILHYQLRGRGPLLLISESGEGDADRSADLVSQLADTYTVLTYDRRGLSRSIPETSGRGATLAEHADDVHRLLCAVTDTPAAMLGCSFGAVIGLHTVLRHPEQVHTLVAHEPVAPVLLSADQRARHERELADLRDLYVREGLAATLPQLASALGIDPAHGDAEPGLTPQPIDDRRKANFDHFIRRDFAAIIDDTLDTAGLATVEARIIPAAGRTTPRTVFDHQCAQAVADLVGREVTHFPGGHNGNTTHPRAYAERLRSVLGSGR